jgi:hypothetical protein
VLRVCNGAGRGLHHPTHETHLDQENAISGKKDEPRRLEEDLLVAGIQAIADGDYAGAADALRVAQEIQEMAEKNMPREKRKG